MSAWSQAVWIVRKLDERFDFQQTIANYTGQLNTLNGKINDLIDDFNDTQDEIAESVSTYVSAASVQPAGVKSTGSIWFKT